MWNRSLFLALALGAVAGCDSSSSTILAGASGCAEDGVAALAASAGGPTLVDVSGGDGADGGDAGEIGFFADDIRIGETAVRAPRTRATATADLTIGSEDWDVVDGDPADLDPDPDTIRTRGSIIIAGTLTVDGDENLLSGEGSICIESRGAIFRNDDPGEDDGAEGPLDDDFDDEFNLGAEDGAVVVRGTIDVSGDDDGADFDANGSSLAVVAGEIFLAEEALVSAAGGLGGNGGEMGFEAANDAATRSGTLVAPGEQGYAIDFRGLFSVPGGAGPGDGGDGGRVLVRTWAPGALAEAVLGGIVNANGGDGSGGTGGDGGDIFLDGTAVGLAGEFHLKGGSGSGDDGGDGGTLGVGGGQKACRIQVAGGDTPADDVDFVLDGGAATATGGEGGEGGGVALVAVARDVFNDANVAATGGAGDSGGDGGGVFFESHHGNIENAGAIDVSGADGSNGPGGSVGGLFTDPDEADDPLGFNKVGVLFIALDGDISNQGLLSALGGDSNSAGGPGGDGGDVMFLVDDADPEDEAGDPDGLGNEAGVDGVELLDNNGGGIFNTADIFTGGGDAGGTDLGEGGDAGDVTMDADPNNDEISGAGAGTSSNTGAISAAGGDAAGSDGPPVPCPAVRLDITIETSPPGPTFVAGTVIELSRITFGNIVSMEPGCTYTHLHAIGPSGSPRYIVIDGHLYDEPLSQHPMCGYGEVITIMKTTGNAAGGDGGDVLLRTAGVFTDVGTVTQLKGADIGSPAEPAVDGVTTID